jgi:glycosyltransferase involved in cell wall biosynthesis
VPRPLISIVTPCFNEEANVRLCAEEVRRVLTEELPDFDYEHIFCDNASTDSTVSVLRELASEDSRIKVVLNSRNVGPLRNVANGLRHTKGDLVVPMIPADVQDPPSVVPEMVRTLTPELDVVYGIRSNRRENFMLRLARNLYYLTIKVGGGTAPPSHAGEFLLARRHVIDAIVNSGSNQPYVRGRIAQTNPRFGVVRYAWGLRMHGKSKNSVPNLIDQAMNGLITTAHAPVRWALLLGILGAAGGILYAIVNLFLFAFGIAAAEPGIATLIVGVFFFGGVQLFFLGLIGEYVVSIHSAAYPEPPVTERELINFDTPGGRDSSLAASKG